MVVSQEKVEITPNFANTYKCRSEVEVVNARIIFHS